MQRSHTAVIEERTARLTLSLRPRNTTQQKKTGTKRRSRRRWLTSWEGLEEYRSQIRAAACEVRTSAAALRGTGIDSVVATGLICAAIRDPSTAPTPEVARAGQAQRDLRDLHSRLVWEHGLDWDFVRREWATLLDPSPVQAARCDELVKTQECINDTREDELD